MPLGGKVKARFPFYRVPYDYSTIHAGIESIKDDGGGKVEVEQDIYIEKPTEIGNIPITINLNNSIIKPSAIDDLVYYFNGLPTWETHDEEIVPIIRDGFFYNDLYTGCRAIEIQDLSAMRLENMRVLGTSSKPWAEGLRLDCTTGHWTEMIKSDGFYTDYVTKGIHALATTGVNSLDHCDLLRCNGNLRTDGDIGFDYADTVLHMANGKMTGQYYLRPTTCTGWKLSGRTGTLQARIGVEVSSGYPTPPVNRIAFDMTGCDALVADDLVLCYVGDDDDYTKIVKGVIKTYNLRIMGMPRMSVGPTALVDPPRYNGSLWRLWTEPIFEGNEFAPAKGGCGPMTAGEDGIGTWDIVVIDNAISNDIIVAEADIHEAPSQGMAMNGGNTSDTVFVMWDGVARRDFWTWNEGVILYMSETEGEMTEIPPSDVGDVVNQVAMAIKDDYVRVFSGGYYNVL